MSIKPPTEAAILRACRQLLDLRRVAYLRNNTGCLRNAADRPVRFGQVGAADLILCVGGRFISVEVKSPTGRLTPAQEAWMARVRAAGGVAAVVRGADELAALLRELEQEARGHG